MKIIQIDDDKDLLQVEDVFSLESLRKINSLDLLNLPYGKVNMQYDLLRRKLDKTHSFFQDLNTELNSKLPIIKEYLKDDTLTVWDDYFLDLPGFTIGAHPDHDSVKVALQVYLNDNDIELGTKFFKNGCTGDDYYSNKTCPVRKHFDYIKNTGYIMINQKQLHIMDVPVPENSSRLSLYCILKS